mmetsp:Transcript_35907/g.94424  ORF Transcript_35907/g.94424 Transcript_35907/m.94424 type:complete len:275 (-) Transcript_35907:1064-1888(-)
MAAADVLSAWQWPNDIVVNGRYIGQKDVARRKSCLCRAAIECWILTVVQQPILLLGRHNMDLASIGLARCTKCELIPPGAIQCHLGKVLLPIHIAPDVELEVGRVAAQVSNDLGTHCPIEALVAVELVREGPKLAVAIVLHEENLHLDERCALMEKLQTLCDLLLSAHLLDDRLVLTLSRRSARHPDWERNVRARCLSRPLLALEYHSLGQNRASLEDGSRLRSCLVNRWGGLGNQVLAEEAVVLPALYDWRRHGLYETSPVDRKALRSAKGLR